MPIRLTGVHLLVTYRCTRECDHCFVWGSPNRSGAMPESMIGAILAQARATGTVTSVFFEGGEPFLEYEILLAGVRAAAQAGFSTGIVTNGFWAAGERDARRRLEPFAGILGILQVSRDALHGTADGIARSDAALAAARTLGIGTAPIAIAGPDAMNAAARTGTAPEGGATLMYRGRAAHRLASRALVRPAASFNRCPHERLADPRRVHVDPDGEVHLCQGISLGNVMHTPLQDICDRYDPQTHPVAGPLIDGGPAQLARQYGVRTADGCADACHLCDATRRALRPRFPAILRPDQMYGGHSAV